MFVLSTSQFGASSDNPPAPLGYVRSSLHAPGRKQLLRYNWQCIETAAITPIQLPESLLPDAKRVHRGCP